jgi:GPH family glycoside/pentoside/hexuronide:cation symporter
VIDHLTLAFILIYGSLAVVAAILFAKFPFGRTEHEARLVRMIAAAEAEGAPHSP